MAISKKEITSIIDKCYSRLLRRVLTAFVLQSAVSYDLELDNLDEVQFLISTSVRSHLKGSLEKEKSLNPFIEKRLNLFLDSVNWESLSKKYCKSLDLKQDKDPIDVDALYQLTEKYHRIEFNDYDWKQIGINLIFQFPPLNISLNDLIVYTDQDDIYNSKNKNAKLAPDWYEASCKELGLIGVFETKEEAKDCFDLYKKDNPDLTVFDAKPVRCLPPGKYFIGDLGLLIDDYENQSKYPDGRDVYQLEDGTVFANFHTWAGDGIYEDEVGWQYIVDTGSIGIFPIKSLPKEDRKIESGGGQRVRFFKHPIICSYNFPVEGCIKLGNTYIFTSLEEVSKEKKKSLFVEGYTREVLLDKRESEKGQTDKSYKSVSNEVYNFNSNQNKNLINWEIGDKVLHSSFGEGKVTHIFGSGLNTSISVDFKKNLGLKMIDPRLAPVKKIGISMNEESKAEVEKNIYPLPTISSPNNLNSESHQKSLQERAAKLVADAKTQAKYISPKVKSNRKTFLENWKVGDKLMHTDYGPGRLIGVRTEKSDSFILIRYEKLEKTEKVYPSDEGTLSVIARISEEEYQDSVNLENT